MLNNLADIKDSLKMDVLLQRSVIFLMAAKHYPIAASSGLFLDRLLIGMMVRCVRKIDRNSNQVSLIGWKILQTVDTNISIYS